MLRLSLAAIAGGGRRGGGSGERAVAYFDEDSVTMAVAAATDCLRGIDRTSLGGVLFAPTSYPYKEKQAASIVAKALDLPRDIVTADFSGSLRAGTTAFRSALDAVKAGSARNILVVASDCRMGAPRSALERNFGDGAAAFLVSDADAAVTVAQQHSVAPEKARAALPRPRRGHQLPRPQVPPLRHDAVPLPARLFLLPREGRF